MRRKLISVLILFSFFCGNAQKPEDLLTTWDQQHPIEKAYLHFDRDNYLAGDTAWFKAYLFSHFRPDTISSVLYVELMNESSILITKKILPVLIGSTNGQLELPDSLVTGTYLVRAFSPTMLNNGTDYIFRKSIFIFGKMKNKQQTPSIKKANNNTRLDFFPEGGNLVAAFTNTIAYKATEESGIPVSVSGNIYNQQNEKIVSFTSYHDGMGMVEIFPKPGEKYYAMLDGDIQAKRYFLPDVADKGIVVTMIPHPQGNFFEIQQRPNDPDFNAAYMIGQMQHQVVFRQELSKGLKEVQGIVNTEKLNSGILQITIFNKEDIPLAERLCFVNNKEYLQPTELRTDTLSFFEKGRNHFKIIIKDTVQGNLSISITDADYALSPLRNNNIISGLLLTSDIRGDVFNPAWYFSSDSDSVRTALDLVMMTNGWRRFVWKELSQNKNRNNVFEDPAFMTITGKVKLRGTNKAYTDKQLVALISAEGMKQNTQLVSTDRLGNFKLDSLLVFGKARIFLIEPLSKKSQYIDIELADDTLDKNFSLEVLNSLPVAGANNEILEAKEKLLSDYEKIKNASGLMLEGVTINARKKTPVEEVEEKYTNGFFSSNAFAVRIIDLVNTEEPIVQENIFDYLISRVPGLKVIEPNYMDAPIPGLDPRYDETRYRLFYRQLPTLSALGNPAMVIYLNEVETDANVIATLPASEIALIKIYSSFAPAEGGASGGAMAIYTKKDTDLPHETKGSVINCDGFSIIKQFYAPDYKIQTSLKSKEDNRITLDWRPNIFVNNINPVIPVSFYNSDRTNRFRVVVEGVTTSGKLISLEKIIAQ
ncbi:MAG: hypothetical protein WBC06_18335 [Chitinophagaceae bacterium]